LVLSLIGLAAGLVGSLLGLGGGVIVVPSLILIGFPVKSAVMLSIFVTIATWSMASEKYIRSGLVDFRVAFLLGLGTSMGALIGSRVLTFMPDRVILILFLTMLGFIGVFNLTARDFGREEFHLTPIRLATATSMFLIGITSSTSALYYGSLPGFSPRTVAVVAVGTLTGAFIGSRLMIRLPVRTLRIIFTAVVILLGVSLLWRM